MGGPQPHWTWTSESAMAFQGRRAAIFPACFSTPPDWRTCSFTEDRMVISELCPSLLIMVYVWGVWCMHAWYVCVCVTCLCGVCMCADMYMWRHMYVLMRVPVCEAERPRSVVGLSPKRQGYLCSQINWNSTQLNLVGSNSHVSVCVMNP